MAERWFLYGIKNKIIERREEEMKRKKQKI